MKKYLIYLFVLLMLLFLVSCTDSKIAGLANLTPDREPVSTPTDSVASPDTGTILYESSTTPEQAEQWYESGVEKIEPFSGTITYKRVVSGNEEGEYYDWSKYVSLDATYTFEGDRVYYSWKKGYTLYAKKLKAEAVYQSNYEEIYNPTGGVSQKRVVPLTTSSFSKTLDIPLKIGGKFEEDTELYFDDNEYFVAIIPGFYDAEGASFKVTLHQEYDDADSQESIDVISFPVIKLGGANLDESQKLLPCPDPNDNYVSEPGNCVYYISPGSDSTILKNSFMDTATYGAHQETLTVDWDIR